MTAEVKRRTPGHTRVSSKNQVTIPVAVMAAAQLTPGDELVVEVRDGEVVLRRVAEPWRALVGTAPGYSAATNLQSLRDEWER